MASEERSPRLVSRVWEELGMASVYHAPSDVKLLCLQRFIRLFAYGASTIILVVYLEALGISKTQIGLFMTLTLAGDICISFFLTIFADGLGRKAILAVGALLMTASGIVFATSGNYWILLVAAIVGVISPSGSEIGPFRAVEESIVAHLTLPKERAHVYAWYGLFGSAGTAFGMLTGGWVFHYLSNDLQWDNIRAYRAIFYIYAGLGAAKFVSALLLSQKVEPEKEQEQACADGGNGETAPLLQGQNDASHALQQPKPKKTLRSLLPQISSGSISVMINLCLLFALDSFASGLATISWITFYFRTHYNIEEGKLGSIFLVTSLVTAASMLVAASLAKRFGNVNTMVFTHLPSSLCLAAMPLPNEVHWSLLFLIIRACTQTMDSPPRTAFLAMIILPSERTAIMGTVNVIRTTSQTLGPLITGLLADKDLLWVSFVVAGSLKACYDVGLLILFKNTERERERAEQERLEGNQSSSP
ncbi:major facilitator superfamily domain-containing protein [Xylariales sp. PMI_506]|nr:major facilitator superfamily domain-containing protein [Xylariales sp. PMI_506]